MLVYFSTQGNGDDSGCFLPTTSYAKGGDKKSMKRNNNIKAFESIRRKGEAVVLSCEE